MRRWGAAFSALTSTKRLRVCATQWFRKLMKMKRALKPVSLSTEFKRRALAKSVAQVSNLPCRSASSLRTPLKTRHEVTGETLPIGNRRYSRLETCATPNLFRGHDLTRRQFLRQAAKGLTLGALFAGLPKG